MAEGSKVVEVSLSCDDERNPSGNDSEDNIHSGSDDGEDSDGSTDALGMEPYQFEPVGNIITRDL